MKRWSKNRDACSNCGTTRRPHKGRGYCTTCYPLVRKLDVVDRWDLRHPGTLQGYPPDEAFRNEAELSRLRKGFTKQIRERLCHLRYVEQKLTGSVAGIDLEYQLRRLAKLAKARDANLYHGVAGFIDDNFGPEQRNSLYRLLLRIEESVPWRGVDFNRIYRGE